MNTFQYIALPLVGLLFVRSIYKLFKSGRSFNILLLSPAVWLAAAFAIIWPGMTHKIAWVLGIGRGADLILYLLVMSFLISIFYIYNRIRKIESNITEIIRHLAHQEATKSPSDRDPKVKKEEGKNKRKLSP